MSLMRKWFGPSKDEVWRQLAGQIGGEIKEGRWCAGMKVAAQVDEWTVTLDTYTVSTGKTTVIFTRMRAPYVNQGGLRFSISRRGFFSDFAHWLGAQDIEIGDPQFDHDFVIKGNDESRIRALLSSSELRRLFDMQPTIQLQIKDDEGWFGSEFPEGVDELWFQTVGVIKDIDRLKALYDLFAELLHQLTRIGSAYAEDPKVTLK